MKFDPKQHRISLNMYQSEMAEAMGWSLRKQKYIETGEAELSPAEVQFMKKIKKMKKSEKKKRYPVDRGK